MQPHTGATIVVINYLLTQAKKRSVKERRSLSECLFEIFPNKIFNIKTSIYLTDGSFFRSKYHDVRTKEYNANQKEMKFHVGKAWACFPEVRHDESFEKFKFIKHRHTHVSEEFEHVGSENFSGKYDSKTGKHKIVGRKSFEKRIEFFDTFIDGANPNKKLRLKYDAEITKIISNK